MTGARWFLLLVDDHTRLCWTFLMKEKSKTKHIFQTFHVMIQNQFKTNIQILKTDNAKDFFNSSLGPYLRSYGIVQQSSCVDTPQQNGVAERKNRHVLEVARSLLFQTNVPNKFWGEAILTATYLINRMPSRVLNFKSPIQMFQGLYPTSHLVSQIPFRLFGCTAFVHVHSQSRSKLDARALKCILLGYSANQKGYKCFSPATRKFYNSMDVTFFENIPFYSNSGIQGEKNKNEFQNWDWSSLVEPNFSSQSSNISSPATPTLVPTLALIPISDVDKHMSPSNSILDQSPIVYPKHLFLPDDAIKVYERRKTRDMPVQNQQGQETPKGQAELENIQNEVNADPKSVSGFQQSTQSSPGCDPELDLLISLLHKEKGFDHALNIHFTVLYLTEICLQNSRHL